MLASRQIGWGICVASDFLKQNFLTATSTFTGGVSLDAFDWIVLGGSVAGPDSVAQFGNTLGFVTTLDAGSRVLEHDLYETPFMFLFMNKVASAHV
ncbi:hypothetical protein B0H19DRAFT_1277095 [Mycena capillaripes]|nr:hypothetical protein B0H19DRAFT_1277095 [Mycena capillaripes]